MRVLLVDDSRAQRAYLRRMMGTLGFDVVEAEDGQRGLEQLARGGRFDLALVDWNMPVMTGIEFVRRSKTVATNPAMKIVMVTSETAMDRMTEALEAGAHEYLMKPFSPDALQQKLDLIGLGGP
jgi:two-component system, chemotaxis family, chemotaxis protein CheY